MRWSLTIVFFWPILSVYSSVSNSSPTGEGQILAREVSSIFEIKCVECHGAQLAHPKGKFGYIVDLPRLAANAEMIVPGHPDLSDLFQLVDKEDMPGDKASQPPLTQEEKDSVRRWIEIGAPPILSAAYLETALVKPVSPFSAHSLSFRQRLIRALGQFHPPSSHFPIALLIMALPAEAMWHFSGKRSWKSVVRFCIMLGAASAVLTATLGWCDAAFSNYTGSSAPILLWHRWIGTATAVWGIFTAILCEMGHRRGPTPRLQNSFRLVLLVGILLVSAAGYLGASLIYGLDHFKW